MKQQSPNYYNGAFQNLQTTPQLAEGISMLNLMGKFFLSRPTNTKPATVIPSIKTDLQKYYSKGPSIIWFGHSSYLIHYNGFNILVDPVLSGYASPFSFYLKAFKGADADKPLDMPEVDMMIITHNHYDHLDKNAIKSLSAKTKSFYMPLGVKENIASFVTKNQPVVEMDWWQTNRVNDQIKLTATPARHFSGRGLKRNQSLWSSFVLEINGYSIFIGSDSGYGEHFKEIGKQFRSFDIAILECGQYNAAWPFIHSMPEELIHEGKELNAKVIMPVHWAKFSLALHDWDEPIKRFVAAAEATGTPYTAPMIGQPVVLDEFYPKQAWWRL